MPPATRKHYLTLYNVVSSVAWASLLYRALAIMVTQSLAAVGPRLDSQTRTTQSFSVLEIVHALLGLVPSPLSTTAMQVASRLLLVWFICAPFPALLSSPFFASMLLAWSATEVIRYSYFGLRLAGGEQAVPKFLQWLRYSAWIVLYPLGISSEVAMMLRAVWPGMGGWSMGPAALEGPLLGGWYPVFLWVAMATYVPGAPILLSHMARQRRRMLKGKEPMRATR